MTATIICPAADATTTSYPVCISDNATPANGTYALYLNPDNIAENWDIGQVGQINTGGDFSTGSDWGKLMITWTLQSCKFKILTANSTNWENFKKAISYWTDVDNNSTLYLVNNNLNSYNTATWPIGGTMTQCTVKIAKVQVLRQELTQRIFNLSLYRVTA